MKDMLKKEITERYNKEHISKQKKHLSKHILKYNWVSKSSGKQLALGILIPLPLILIYRRVSKKVIYLINFKVQIEQALLKEYFLLAKKN